MIVFIFISNVLELKNSLGFFPQRNIVQYVIYYLSEIFLSKWKQK